MTQEFPCRIEKVYEKFDPTSIKLTEEDASSIQDAEVADVLIQLDGKTVVDLFNEIPEMGRFVLEKDGRPVAGGIIPWRNNGYSTPGTMLQHGYRSTSVNKVLAAGM